MTNLPLKLLGDISAMRSIRDLASGRVLGRLWSVLSGHSEYDKIMQGES